MIRRDQAIEAAAELVVEELLRLIRDLADPDPCTRHDHHGYCQTHGWLTTARQCPHARAQALLTRKVLERLDAAGGGQR